MKTPQILTGQQALDQFGLNALIECRVAVTTELNGLGHIVMGIGVIADPDNCFIDLSDEPASLYVEIEQGDDWILHPIMADEQFVLLDDKNPPAKSRDAKTPEQIYLIPDAEHGHVWHTDATPAEGMREEDATRYVRADLVPESNATLARRIVELTNELATANSMHVDNDRYKWEQLGFGCVDDLIEHYVQTMQEVQQFKSVINSELAQLVGAGVRANYGKESVNAALTKYWVPVVALSEELTGYPTEDDKAVNRFAIAMKAKMAAARAKGRSGWDDKESCSGEYLAYLLVEHLKKDNPGTFQDVALFAMMMHERGDNPRLLRNAIEQIEENLIRGVFGADKVYPDAETYIEGRKQAAKLAERLSNKVSQSAKAGS